MSSSRIDLRKYVVIPVWYGCNNDCTLCMLTGLKEELPAVEFDLFKSLVERVGAEGRFDNLIISGAEITTFGELERYAGFASSLGRFRKIQIQTNGRMLSSRKFVEKILKAGVNEFFVSIHGLEEIHDSITRIPGSWAQTMTGIKIVQEYNVNVLTNTVLTTRNLEGIPALMGMFCDMPTSEIHMWNFYPMEEHDSGDLIVSMDEYLRLLEEVAPIVLPSSKPLVLKSFPECVPVPEPCIVDNGYPMNIIHQDFWDKFSSNRFGTCVLREECEAAECWGLSYAYSEKYGDERARFIPVQL